MEMGGGQVPPGGGHGAVPGGQMPPQGGQYGGQPGYGAPQPQQPQQQQQYGGGGGGMQAMQSVQRATRTPETKPFFLTSEFGVYLFTVIGLAIAGAVVGGDDGDDFEASLVWTLITVIGLAYIISRGISKAGQKYRSNDGGQGGQGGGPGGF